MRVCVLAKLGTSVSKTGRDDIFSQSPQVLVVYMGLYGADTLMDTLLFERSQLLRRKDCRLYFEPLRRLFCAMEKSRFIGKPCVVNHCTCLRLNRAKESAPESASDVAVSAAKVSDGAYMDI